MIHMNKKGQFSIIAALLVAIVLVTAIITTYSTIRNNPLQERPQVLGSISEMNLAISRILEFVVGYYGSILQVTGNTTYAKSLAADYLQSSLENIAYTNPNLGPSFQLNYSSVTTTWFNRTSSSEGVINVTYSLMGIGISGVQYTTSAGLEVTVNPSNTSSVLVNVTRNCDEPYPKLGQNNFFFYNYSYTESTWKLSNTGLSINSIESTETYSTYNITVPSGIDHSSYMLQVVDPRGIMVTASTFSHYTYTFSWNGTLYSSLSQDTIVVEALQNGTLRWLGQNLETTTAVKPIPPIPVKAFHVNQTVNGANREVPFQVEDWGSEYRVPAGLTSNASVFGGRQMLVFLINHNVENVTLWWDGRDIANQTSYAWKNRYFNDDPSNGILANEDLVLIMADSHLYVDGFDWTDDAWDIESGSPPYLDDSNSYISDNDDNHHEGWFSFQNFTNLQVRAFAAVKSVKIQFESRCSGDDRFDFQIDTGSQIFGYYAIDPPNDWGWMEYDLSSILDSVEEVNNVRLRVRYTHIGGDSSNVYIRRCRLFVFDGWVTSIVGNSSAKADFLRINGESPIYGSDPAYVIHHGVVRDIVQQEAEWQGNGAPNCPNTYSQIVLTLPANATYYTYALRTIFVDSSGVSPVRTLTELSVLQLSIYPGESGTGECITENGINATGFPIPSNLEGLFYNSSSPTGWAHHWSEFLKGNKGAGIMFTNNSNFKLYTFDSSEYASNKTGALDIDKQTSNTTGYIEVNPVEQYQTSFVNPLDITWFGAVVTFEGEPIYKSLDETGLWVMVESPPTVAVSATG